MGNEGVGNGRGCGTRPGRWIPNGRCGATACWAIDSGPNSVRRAESDARRCAECVGPPALGWHAPQQPGCRQRRNGCRVRGGLPFQAVHASTDPAATLLPIAAVRADSTGQFSVREGWDSRFAPALNPDGSIDVIAIATVAGGGGIVSTNTMKWLPTLRRWAPAALAASAQPALSQSPGTSSPTGLAPARALAATFDGLHADLTATPAPTAAQRAKATPVSGQAPGAAQASTATTVPAPQNSPCTLWASKQIGPGKSDVGLVNLVKGAPWTTDFIYQNTGTSGYQVGFTLDGAAGGWTRAGSTERSSTLTITGEAPQTYRRPTTSRTSTGSRPTSISIRGDAGSIRGRPRSTRATGRSTRPSRRVPGTTTSPRTRGTSCRPAR